MNKTDILKLDVYSEEFLTFLYAMLEKFNNEYDDMANMAIIKKVQDLLDAFDNAN